MGVTMDTIVSLCKRRGFIFQSSEIYGGTGSCWDYGPLGVEMKNNVKRLWWRDMIHRREDVVGLDASILMHPKVWEASGHVAGFNDPMVDCKKCKSRFRSDEAPKGNCPRCGAAELTEPRQFNMMFKTHMGAVEDSASVTYLRPETAQGIFVNFDNVLTTSRKKLPFGIAQIGKSFRNEITPGNFIFRTREFEQMEMEFFVKPGEDDQWYRYWIAERHRWYLRYGIREGHLRIREHAKEELAHYSKATSDIEYEFPMGWSELEGIANRTDFDLKQHSKACGKELVYFEQESNSRFTPYVIEPSAGVDRSFLVFLLDAWHEEEVRGEKRVLLKFHPEVAPIKVAVLPLLKKRDDIVRTAKEIRDRLMKRVLAVYDDTAAIGKLYRRQDEIGTPLCVTVDVKTVGDAEKGEAADRQVTLRDRDTMEQIRVPIDRIEEVVLQKLGQ